MSKLRQVRESRGLKRAFVAKKLAITPDHLNLLERGKAALNLKKIEVLATIYNMSFEETARVALDTIKESGFIG
ncbi:DNA-binding protein [Clostridium botulinum C str. Eklund]|nr:DNA-binding protein [Clostridium botulinum C str. Eklund]NEZ48578.1 helix-turn-helix transcriptional regulator [Clostridium botulinum]